MSTESLPGFPEVTEDIPAGVDPDTGEITDDQDDTGYPTVGAFVHEYLLGKFPHPVKHNKRWCPYWWEHPEALEVFLALWRSWEDTNPEDMAGWLRDLMFPLMDRLLSDQGPFTECNARDCYHDPAADMAPLLTVELPDGI